jgi:hypothetical protein
MWCGDGDRTYGISASLSSVTPVSPLFSFSFTSTHSLTHTSLVRACTLLPFATLAEFDTVELASEAMRVLQGHQGMHVAYSKNPLNRRLR